MLKIKDTPIGLGHFPDGTLHMEGALYYDRNAFGKIQIDWCYENDAELFALICLVNHIRYTMTNPDIVLFMPYVPHARMDRVKSSRDVFTLKYFAEIINSLRFDEVIVLDPHSHVSEALIDNLYVIHPYVYLEGVIEIIRSKGDFMLFYPDEGAMKRYASDIKIPYCFGIKNRDWETGRILGLNIAGKVEDIAGKNILIVDDICSRGGTFLHSARRLKEVGAEDIYLFVSHCENTILQGELLDGDLIKRVYTTNSIFTASHPKIEVISIV